MHSSLGSDQLQTASTLSVLKRILELFGQQRIEEVLAVCCPELTCSWSVTSAIGNVYVAGGRNYARWGSSGVLVDNKLYIFGGRGSDNRSRGSMHILDCNQITITQLKTITAPEPRDGHSCVYYDGKLVIFGGCEGSEDDKTIFGRVHMLDLTTREWFEFRTTGPAPNGRDGHAAALIDDTMVIYGGSSTSELCGDILGLHLVKGTWQVYEIEGDAPGPRESMSCTTLGNSIYVFGGNTNADTTGADIYSNELYRLDVKQRVVESVLIRPFTGSPPARLSCSMSAVTPSMLVVFGGECGAGMLHDIWVHHLNLNTWCELRPRSDIEGRIAHIGTAYRGKLLIFGGMDKDTVTKSEIAMLNITQVRRSSEDLKNRQVAVTAPPRAKRVMPCVLCLHNPSICADNSYPGFAYPNFHYMSRIFSPRSVLDEAIEQDNDWCNNFLHFLELILTTEVVTLYIRCPNALAEDGLGNGQSASARPFRGKGSVTQLILTSDKGFDPQPFASFLLRERKSIDKELRVISSHTVFVSKTEEFTTCCYLSGDQPTSLQCLTIYDSKGILLSPAADSSVLGKIYKEISYSDIMNCKTGFTICLKPKGVTTREGDIIVPSVAGPLSLSQVLRSLYFKPLNPAQIFVNGSKVIHDFAKFTRYQHKQKSEKCIIRFLDVSEGWAYDMRIYWQNTLLMFKLKEEEKGNKRRRSVTSKSCDILITDPSLVDLRALVRY